MCVSRGIAPRLLGLHVVQDVEQKQLVGGRGETFRTGTTHSVDLKGEMSPQKSCKGRVNDCMYSKYDWGSSMRQSRLLQSEP